MLGVRGADMKQPSRRRRMLKWAGVAISLLFVVAWSASLRWQCEYGRASQYHHWSLILANGRCGGSVAIFDDPQISGSGWVVRQAPRRVDWLPWFASVDHGSRFPSPPWRGHAILLPLWMPFLIVAIPTAYLWWIGRRRVPPGRCQRCGYDLTGNISGTCPECGKKIADHALLER